MNVYSKVKLRKDAIVQIKQSNKYKQMLMPQPSGDPLHGITLKAIVEQLYEYYGWEELAARIRINCFYENPSINSSLKFLRKTPWARTEVEELYIDLLKSRL